MMKKVLYRIMSNGITNRGRRVFWSLSFIVVILGAGLFSNNNASAAATKTDVMRKWVYTQYYYCAMNHINQEINVESNGLVADSVFSNEEEDVMLPSYDFEYSLDRIANDFTYDKITCRQLFEGFDGFNHGVLDYSGLNKNIKWQNRTAANDFLDQIGYYPEENNTFSFRIQAMMKVDGDAPYIVYSPNIIGSYNKNQNHYEYEVEGGNSEIDFSNGRKEYGLGVSIEEQQLTVFAYPPHPIINCSATEGYPESISINLDGVGFEDTAETIKKELVNKTMVVSNCYNSTADKSIERIVFSFAIQNENDFTRDDIVVSSAAKYIYGAVKDSQDSKYYTTIRAIYRMMSGQEAQVNDEVKIVNEMMTFGPAERYLLYEYYLRKNIPDFVEDKIVCDVDEGLNNLEEVLLKVDGTIKRCYVNFGGADIDSIVVSTQGTRAGTDTPSIETISMRDVVNWLNDPDNVNKDNLAGVTGMDKTDFNDLEGETCGSGGAAGSLGWILCPLLNFMQGSTESLYEDFVEPALTVSPKLFSVSNSDSEDGNGVVYNAWEIFQRFSNIAFIILLLVVIFSQLTGVGIDNYGIKKILPKMIVGVILINVSYYVCLLAIDLSNVIGVGIQNIFEKMGEGIPFGKIEGQEFVYGSMGSVSFLAVIMTISTIWANPAILLSLLVSALGLLTSIVFMFLILSARQAMLVVLTVVAPVTIACYILPNTKTVFSKWLKAGWMLLLVFPICGLMVGGGNFVSKLLLGVADGNIYSAIIAMVAGIAPIFFIPSVLKWSLTAVGKVGGVLSGLGDTARRGVTGTLNKNPHLQNLKKAGEDRANRIRLRRQAGGYVDAEGKFHASGLRSRIAGSGLGKLMGMDARMQQARESYMEASQARQRASAGFEVGVKPLLNKDNLRTRLQNEINEAMADNDVEVLSVDVDLARQRKQSARNAQEFKAFQDQFDGMEREKLVKLARDSSGPNGWFNAADPSGQQKMRALIRTMNNKGMENDVFNMLGTNNDIGNSESVMEELANSNNKVMKAYGKKGASVSYNDFMSGKFYRDANGNLTRDAIDASTGRANDSVSMKRYVEEKGTDFLDGLDDKALAQINNHSSNANQIMSNDLVVEGLARINSQDAVNELEKMALERMDNGDNIGFSGEQLVRFNESTTRAFSEYANDGSKGGNATTMRNNLQGAVNDIVRDNLVNRLKRESRDSLLTVSGITGI